MMLHIVHKNVLMKGRHKNDKTYAINRRFTMCLNDIMCSNCHKDFNVRGSIKIVITSDTWHFCSWKCVNEYSAKCAETTGSDNTCLPLEEQSNTKRQKLKAHSRNQIGDVKSGNAVEVVEGTEIQAVRNKQKPSYKTGENKNGK